MFATAPSAREQFALRDLQVMRTDVLTRLTNIERRIREWDRVIFAPGHLPGSAGADPLCTLRLGALTETLADANAAQRDAFRAERRSLQNS